MANRPSPEIEITEELVRHLLDDQAPQLRDLEVELLSRGWDNTSYRIGDDLIARVPHRSAAAELVVNEQRWLPMLSERIDLAIPVPIVAGAPTDRYPWHWSVVPFFPGVEAARTELADPADAARVLGTFFAQTHTRAPVDAPVNPFRGCPLEDRRSAFDANMDRLDDRYDQGAIRRVFDDGATAPAAESAVWLHGDLHLRNLVVDRGRLTAVIDWGDICRGDRATDLAGTFMLVPGHVDIVASIAGATDDDLARARGWAVNFAVVYLVNSDDDPVMRRIGDSLLEALLEP